MIVECTTDEVFTTHVTRRNWYPIPGTKWRLTLAHQAPSLGT